MEEVDRIIIESLRHLNCDIEEEIITLKDFTPDTVVSALSTCLETINPQIKYPKKLPLSMSARIKFASNLAEQIKEFGFKGDMGYQTILYCNEVEVRRVLMFLLERVPKETSHATASIEPMGYVLRILKQIEDNLKESLSKLWLPSEIFPYGVRSSESESFINSFGHSKPVDNVNLIIPNANMSLEEAFCIPPVHQQCSSRQLLPSLLFEASRFDNINSKEILLKTSKTQNMLDNIGVSETISEIKDIKDAKENKGIKESKIEVLLTKLKEKKEALLALQKVVNENEEKLFKVKSHREEEQQLLKEATAKVKVKNKTLAVLSNEENKLKLKNLIKKNENRLVELANQWIEVQTPLLEEHKALKNSVSSESLKYQEETNKLRNLKQTYKEMIADFENKTILEQNLIARCKELNNKNNRAAYTKRILEIVGNIQKQKKEIQKILFDTKQVQKDIKNLTGQVDRSFTLSDELIFYDCKHDETSRKAYKLLAGLRQECNGILQAVTDLGQAERELRNLEEQLETEKNKDIRDKLEKVQRDLAEIRKEIEVLM